MSENDKFQECLDCSGCSGDCGQGCGCCPENMPAQEAEGSVEAKVEATVEVTAETASDKESSDKESSDKESSSSDNDASEQSEQVDINPMDLEEVARKTEDLAPKIDPSRGKLDCFNYLADIPGGKADYDIVEVQFKNTRKGFYRNTANLDLKLGDMVAVESQPGHDIGRVTLVGHLVRNQMKKAGLSEDSEIRKIFRFARESDMEKYYEAKALEIPTMIGSRQIAAELGLKMKIGDVEYQGDGLKAIFYYIADERVDFRQLIKILAERFKIRVEMRQIGARQEAGRIGGIGPCGRPLCCSTWMTNFVTVATSAARHQDLSLNPQKLAGQCAKLKCCLNFEIDTYLESVKKMPPKETRLETLEASWYHFKTDIFKGEITYSSDKKNAVNTVTITAERAFEIIEMNTRGEKPLSLMPDEEAKTKAQGSYNDILGDDSQIGRFDKKKKKKKKKKDKDAQGNAAAASATNDSSDTIDESAEESARDANLAEANIAKEDANSKQKNNSNSEADVKANADKEVSLSKEVEPSESTSEAEPQTESSKYEVEEKADRKEGQLPLEAEEDENVKVAEPIAKDEPSVELSEQTTAVSFEEVKIQHKEEKPVGQYPENTRDIESETVEFSQAAQEASGKETDIQPQISEVEQAQVSVEESEESDAALEKSEEAETTEAQPQHKHHHQNHQHHHNHDNNLQGVNTENGADSGDVRNQNRKGNNPNPNNSNPNNPNKPQWQGKNQGKGFKPQQGKGQHQHGQQPRGQQSGQQSGQQPGQQPGQQAQGQQQFKPKGQNPSQDRHNKDNQRKDSKSQRPGEGGQRPDHQGHQGQGQNHRNEDSHPQGGSNFKKKKNKKSYSPKENAANSKEGSQHGDQGRGHNQGHHNQNRPQQGSRPSQDQGQRNPNPNNGNGE